MQQHRQAGIVDYARLEVCRLGSWIWQIHENQSYLGRMILRLNRSETGSLSHCTGEEWGSLHGNLRAYERLLEELFAPDRFNYSQLGNVFSQLHVQAVPRYAADRTWRNVAFHDGNWGKNWAPTPPSPLAIEQTYELASWFREEARAKLPRR